jgi:hypothetical protein
MVACILAIVYSPFVDLPLTDARGNHSPVPSIHALPALPITLAESSQGWVVVAAEQPVTAATDVVAITCAYLC